MELGNPDAAEVIRRALDHARAIDSFVTDTSAFARSETTARSLAATSRRELDGLRTVAAGAPSDAAYAQAMAHLDRLDEVLSLALGVLAECVYAIADRVAVAEEFHLDGERGAVTSVGAAALGDKLADLGWAHASRL